MHASELVQKFSSNLKQQQWETASPTLSNDFTASGWSPQPLGRKDWLVINQAFATAVPEKPVECCSIKDKRLRVALIKEISLRNPHALEG
ncbi:MAG TPA: hypothetical protein VH540_10165 [Ktedonobacterales bacterium]|jgi:hypothetical protein